MDKQKLQLERSEEDSIKALLEQEKLFKVFEDFIQLHFKFVEVDNSFNAVGIRGCKVFGVYTSGDPEPLRNSHVEGEKIPIDERHEQVAI